VFPSPGIAKWKGDDGFSFSSPSFLPLPESESIVELVAKPSSFLPLFPPRPKERRAFSFFLFGTECDRKKGGRQVLALFLRLCLRVGRGRISPYPPFFFSAGIGKRYPSVSKAQEYICDFLPLPLFSSRKKETSGLKLPLSAHHAEGKG